MGNKIIWSLLILLISFAACGKSSKNNVARQPHIEKIDTDFQKDDEEFNKKVAAPPKKAVQAQSTGERNRSTI
jgi:hypothetical protein